MRWVVGGTFLPWVAVMAYCCPHGLVRGCGLAILILLSVLAGPLIGSLIADAKEDIL